MMLPLDGGGGGQSDILGADTSSDACSASPEVDEHGAGLPGPVKSRGFLVVNHRLGQGQVRMPHGEGLTNVAMAE